MKRLMKYMKVCAGLLLMAGTSACNHDDFLTVDYYDIIDGDMMFTSIENAESGLIGCYDMFYPNSDYCGDWGLKPQIMLGDHPTLDTQATAWDRNYCIQAWTADDNDISNGWNHAYHAISRCNTFIKGLKEADFEESDKVMMMAEARAIRAWFYMFLTQSWGRVPMLDEEDTYATAPNKARAENEAAMWDFIIADLQYAADNLTWAPRNNEAGRVTKGMATAYLAEAYMWKAYKHSADYATYDTFATPDESVETSSYLIAEELLKSIIDSGQYELNPSFTTLWDPGAVWTKEALWEVVYQRYDNGGAWGGQFNYDCKLLNFYCACPDLGGWGTLYLSWEWWMSYEDGDRRRDASGITAPVTDLIQEKGEVGHIRQLSDGTYVSTHPYLQQDITHSTYKRDAEGEKAPAIWSLKWWRTTRADWGQHYISPLQIYYKRYANVLLDYAECRFRNHGADDATGWEYIAQIRDRAFGNREVGRKAELTAIYLPYYQEQFNNYYTDRPAPTEYPIPFQEEAVTVPDARTYYTQVKNETGMNSPVWLVALTMERRKEFNAEFCLKFDLQRSGVFEDYINHVYPKNVGYPDSDPAALNDYHYYRSWDHNNRRLLFPIPNNEILKNDAISTEDQNAGY